MSIKTTQARMRRSASRSLTLARGQLYSGTFTPYFKTFQVGQRVVVRYDPDDPGKNHLVESQKSRRFLWWVVSGLIVIACVAGWVLRELNT